MPYTVADMVAQLTAGVASVLPWVGAGVGGGLVLMLLFLGIRSAFSFFGYVSEGRKFAAFSAENDARFDWAIGAGYTRDEAWLYTDGEKFDHTSTTGNAFL